MITHHSSSMVNYTATLPNHQENYLGLLHYLILDLTTQNKSKSFYAVPKIDARIGFSNFNKKKFIKHIIHSLVFGTSIDFEYKNQVKY